MATETNDHQAILERLDRMEALLAPMAQRAAILAELKEELAPRLNELAKHLIIGLADVEDDLTLEDLALFAEKSARSIRGLTRALDLLNSGLDLVDTAEPLLRGTVPHLIAMLDELERTNVFRMLATLLDGLKAVGENLGEEDVARAGRALEVLAGALPRADVDRAGAPGPLGMLGALRDPQTRRGMGVLLELARALAPPDR